MTADWTKIKVADGTEMRVFFAREDKPAHDLFSGAPLRPTLLVLQEAFGVTHHIQSITRRFADLGFIAAAPELYHRTAEGFAAPYTDIAKAMPHMQALTDEGQTFDLQATGNWLASQKNADLSRMAAIGYCMGGRSAFLANTVMKLKCAVSYYGGRVIPSLESKFSAVSGPVLFCWGGLDKHIGDDQKSAIIEHMKKAGKHYVNIEFGDADHGFNCDDRASFHKPSADQALALVKQFFTEHV